MTGPGAPFGARKIRCEWYAYGRKLVAWLTPQELGMSDTTIANMERLEVEGDSRPRRRKEKAV